MAHNVDVKFYPGWTRKAITFSIDDGILDSLDIVTLITDINDAFDVAIPPEEILPENFNSAKALWELIERLDNI